MAGIKTTTAAAAASSWLTASAKCLPALFSNLMRHTRAHASSAVWAKAKTGRTDGRTRAERANRKFPCRLFAILHVQVAS